MYVGVIFKMVLGCFLYPIAICSHYGKIENIHMRFLF